MIVRDQTDIFNIILGKSFAGTYNSNLKDAYELVKFHRNGVEVGILEFYQNTFKEHKISIDNDKILDLLKSDLKSYLIYIYKKRRVRRIIFYKNFINFLLY